MIDLAQAVEIILAHFDGDESKAMFWLTTPNPNFGGIAPSDLIKMGRGQKVYRFIQNAVMGEFP